MSQCQPPALPANALTSGAYRESDRLKSERERRHTDGQQAHEKMLNIVNHQRNAN